MNIKLRKITAAILATFCILSMCVACSDTNGTGNSTGTNETDSKNNITDTKPNTDKDNMGTDLKDSVNSAADDMKDMADDLMGSDSKNK